MEKAIPVFYTEYGRYISRFRSMPFYADCLIPIYRRLLLSMHEMARGPKTVKSSKVIGHVIGSYSPHGDLSAYGALISLSKQGFLKTQGNFGSPGLTDGEASAMRYTECSLTPFIEDFCFKYIDCVPWEVFEFENEPLFLPCPIPLGLIGTGDIYSGIAFHRCIMPRYHLSDLAKRLKWLLSGSVPTEEPIIYPNFTNDGCSIQRDDLAAQSILTTGIGTLTLIPNGRIDNKKLHILGRVPQTNFSKLREDTTISINDLSGATIDIEVKPLRKQDNLQEFFSNIYQKYLIKNINFNICVCDEAGKVAVRGIDTLLLTCYQYYVECVKFKLIDDCTKEIERRYENEIILIVREVLKNNPTVKSTTEITQILRAQTVANKITTNMEEYDFEKDIWIRKPKEILDEEIKEICSHRTIKALIEQNVNINNNDVKIVSLKNQIVNNVNDNFKLICDLAAKV